MERKLVWSFSEDRGVSECLKRTSLTHPRKPPLLKHFPVFTYTNRPRSTGVNKGQ